ncbi:heme biosynthesis HemY N-terminal domain-containing protein [Variovorax sp. VNK109]|uniref:heme biosynthesis HemY N-terminal domain-containing protein n=1 Tax=Variovorax sp. VNK109 TaxID=3400919 RepID=UPI003C0D940D
MRAALWFLALFGVAVAAALLAGNNQGVVTVFWPPWRVDLSVNMVVLALFALFAVTHITLRALAALFDLPGKARDWRMQQRERAMHAAVLDAISHLLAGRFIRSRKSALNSLTHERALLAMGSSLPHTGQLRALAHVLAAESAQSLQDTAARDQHLHLALEQAGARSGATQETLEGIQLQAARWALDERDPQAALDRLAEMPQGAQRRTLALRLRLKAARQTRRTLEALETARLLAKHKAFSAGAAQSIVRGLATDLINGAHDTTQLQRAWESLDVAERAMPDVAIHAAQRLINLHGDATVARGWLLPVWERMVAKPDALNDQQRVRLVRALESARDPDDAAWLARIENAQMRNPRDANLQYLAGMACMKRQLWGKAQQLLTQAALALQDPTLHRNACKALAELAEQRGDEQAAALAWKRAAQA